MDCKRLLRKKERYQQGKDKISQLTIASYEQAFEIEYTIRYIGMMEQGED
ncbi:MAG: hypothetical protein LIO92_02380 [Clostridiales bacterium]|nr:hypothetical protein [Clostridiales bacterium]